MLCCCLIGTSAAMATEDAASLGALLQDPALAGATLGALPSAAAEREALVALSRQAIASGIDYKQLGLGWDHPDTRLAYRRADGNSFRRSAARQAQSRDALVGLSKAVAGGASAEEVRGLLVRAFCTEIGAPRAFANATFVAVSAALKAELLLPLRALNEGIDSLTKTFNGAAVPRQPVQEAVDAVTSHVLDGTYAAWRYSNPVGEAQLAGLSAAQRAAWIECSSSEPEAGLRVYEEGALDLFWATKIGGPSHGFDIEGQCLLPLLCNARHKVILVSDAAWPHHPCGRAHFRLLWVAGAAPARPVLWLETINVDFAASGRVDSRRWRDAVLALAIRKADTIGAELSVETSFGRDLARLAGPGADVREVSDKLVLRPSNGVVEASDYLSHKHDWVQLKEEITAPLRRSVYFGRREQREL